MILIKDFTDLHIRVDKYFYLLLLQTEGNINNYFFNVFFFSCFATLKCVSMLLGYLA